MAEQVDHHDCINNNNDNTIDELELRVQQLDEIMDYKLKMIDQLKREMVELQIRTDTHVVDSRVETEICTICQDEYEEGDSVGILDCGHRFHCECVTNWLVVNNSCPLCKSVGVPYDGHSR